MPGAEPVAVSASSPLGWHDERSHALPERIRESGLTGKPIETLIDHIEFAKGAIPSPSGVCTGKCLSDRSS